MIEFIKKYYKFFEIAILFLLSLTPLLWIRDNYIILGHDSGFRLDTIQHLKNLFYSWDPSSNFGTDWSWFKGFIITQLPETLFISLTKSFTLGQQLTFIFWFFCIGISMYIFINGFFKEKEYWFFRVFASTFYMYNFFLLQAWFIAERAKFSLFCAIPLGVLLISKTLTREYSVLKGVVFFSLMSFLLNAGGNLTFYGTLILIYGITFIYLTAVNIRKLGNRELIYSFKVGILFLIGFLTFNAYWFLPQLYSFLSGYGVNLSSVGGIDSILTWESVITKNASLLNLLRLEGIPDWYDNSSHTYAFFYTKFQPLIVVSFIPFLILLFGLMNYKKKSIEKRTDKIILLILLLFILGLFFTAGSHPPFGNIYIFLIKFIPGFAIFRSAFYKFGAVLWFSYIFLISYYLNSLLLNILNRRKTYALLVVFSFCSLLAYHSPFFYGNFFLWNDPFTTKVNVPTYVNGMADHINKLPFSSRILLLPKFDNQADSYQWGFWGIDSLPRLITNKSIIANSASHPEIINSIYNSISKNDEELFLRLVGISGINKLLWRNDVLYSDKAKTSVDLISIKNNFEKFKGIRLEKKAGEWILYSIDSPYYRSTFSSLDKLIYAQSNLSALGRIFDEQESFKNPAILFDKSLIDKNRDILLFSDMNIAEAQCVACGSMTFSRTKGGLLMSDNVKILPSSPFYILSSLKEQQVQGQYKNIPVKKIDADLGYASKRIVEMKEIAGEKVKNKDSIALIIEAIKKYKVLINDAGEQASTLPEDQRNEALMKILIYLNSQFYFLSPQGNLYNYDFENFEDLSIFMQDRIKYFADQIWATDFTQDKLRFFLTIDTSGLYSVKTGDKQAKAVSIDGKNLTGYENLALNKGIHKLEVVYPESENLIGYIDSATESAKLSLQFGERITFPVKDFDPNETYFVSFDYKVLQGRPDASIIFEKGKIKQRIWNLLLNQNDFWNSFSSLFRAYQSEKSVGLDFYPTGFQTTGATIQIRNLKIIKAHISEVLLSRNTPAVTATSPNISFDRINSTMYKVNIENARSPFVLSFGEAYAKGWRAYIADNFFQTFFMKSLSESNHYALNGYSNGWLVDKKGNYTIIVEYYPQKIFYLGLFISMISVFISILIFVKTKGKR